MFKLTQKFRFCAFEQNEKNIICVYTYLCQRQNSQSDPNYAQKISFPIVTVLVEIIRNWPSRIPFLTGAPANGQILGQLSINLH